MRTALFLVVVTVSGTIVADAADDTYPTTIDLDDQVYRQVVVDREAGQYLGHPTTCLLEDGQTMLCVYPKGHGRGAIVYKRSKDGGRTWSDRLPTPESWATSKEVPTLHRVLGPDGQKRIILWSGLYPARLAVTEDDGITWSELKPVGDWGGIVVMGFVEALKTGKGHYLAMFHDDGRFIASEPIRNEVRTFDLYQTVSQDGGLTWSRPESVYRASDVHLCEPGCIRSPDGKTLAVLLRENARRKHSHVIFPKTRVRRGPNLANCRWRSPEIGTRGNMVRTDGCLSVFAAGRLSTVPSNARLKEIGSAGLALGTISWRAAMDSMRCD